MRSNILKRSVLFVAGAITVLSLGVAGVGAASAVTAEHKRDNVVQLAEQKRDVFLPADQDCCNN